MLRLEEFKTVAYLSIELAIIAFLIISSLSTLQADLGLPLDFLSKTGPRVLHLRIQAEMVLRTLSDF